MTKSELTISMRTFVGGGSFITKPEISKWLRISKDKAPQLVEGLAEFGDKHKRYFIPEVAERVLQRRI